MLKKRKLQYFRRLMKGYRSLRKMRLLASVNQIKRDFTNFKFEERDVSKIIFGESHENAEVVYRQYLLMKIANENLSKAILYSYSEESLKLAYPLPRHWQRIIQSYGFRVSRIKCSILWCIYILYVFFKSIIFVNKTIITEAYKLIFSSKKSLGDYVFFDGLTLNNLPGSNQEKGQMNIINWYMQWPNKVKGIRSICHSVRCKKLKLHGNLSLISVPEMPFVGINSFGLARYVWWAMSAFFIACLSLLRGHWWNVIMFGEASKSTYIRLLNKKKLAREYLFNNSSWIYRPFWTHEAEKKGSLISFYFYSTNNEGFKRSSEDDSYKYYYGYKSMTWPRYLVWDQGQADFIHRIKGKNVEVEVVGDIWFHDGKHEIEGLPKNSFAVFDVQPVRDYLYQSLCIDFDYYTPDNCNKFILDIYEELVTVDYQLMFKQKRNIGKLTHPKYTNNLSQLRKKSNFNFIDSELSPRRMIERSDAVISMPFSSTAIIARNLGKPSIYYDALGLIQKDDRGAHGVPVLIGRNELKKWINNVVKK